MFDDLVGILRNRQWGSRFKDGERNIDTGVQELADELARYFSNWGREPIDQHHTLIFNNQTNGPSIVINNEGDVDHHGVWVLNEAGQSAKLGIGLGSEGLIANEIIVRPEYIMDPEIVHTAYSDVASGNGGATLTPNTAGPIPGAAPGAGWKPNNFHVSAKDNGSYSSPDTQFGSGYGPHRF